MKVIEMQKNISPVDITLFAVVLILPTFIGLYFAYKDRHDTTTKSYFYGGKKMHPIAVGISTAVTSISALTMIGYPVEVYLVGSVFFWAPLAIITAAIVAYVYYVPFYSKLQMDTIYHYLERRFNTSVKLIVALMVLTSEVFFMGSIIYLPAVALNAVAPVKISWSIAMIGCICTFYTALGGMAAVVWTDVVQSVFMIAASIILFTFGTNAVGGVDEISAALQRGDRDTFLKFDDFHISSRMHPIALFIGEFFVFTHYLGFSQPIYQRILSCKNTRKSQQSIIAYVVPALIIITVSIGNGLLLYAYFEGCDPLTNGDITRRDQMIPFMAAMEFKNTPGLTGIFVAAVFSGTLSTISSGLNGYSAVIVQDFCPICFKSMSENFKVRFGKLCALILGFVVMGTAYFISTAGQNVFKLIRCFVGSLSGSVLGIFLLGIFVPWTNSVGALVGGMCGYILMIWIFIGSTFFLHVPSPVSLPPITTKECTLNNATSFASANTTTYTSLLVTTNNVTVGNAAFTFDQLVYSLNFHYYVLTGCLFTIVIGLSVSLITGRQQAKNADPTLFMPVLDNACLPRKLVKFFRCGVPHEYIDAKVKLNQDGPDI